MQKVQSQLCDSHDSTNGLLERVCVGVLLTINYESKYNDKSLLYKKKPVTQDPSIIITTSVKL